MINEEGFTEEDLKYINEPFNEEDLKHIEETKIFNNFKKITYGRKLH